MILVTMARPSGTQTRQFIYNNTAFLQSATNPESGTVTYTYDSQNRLSTVVDAKNQKRVTTYDSYNRVTQVQRYVKSGGVFVEDPMARTNFYFDSNPFGTSTYVSGRLAAVQYYGGHCSSYVPSGTQSGCDLIQQWYSYDAPGARLSKTVKVTRGSASGSLTTSWTYDTEGRPLTSTYPSWSGNLGSKYTLVSGMSYGVANEILAITSGYTTGVNSESRTLNSMFQLTRLQVASALDISYAYSATQNNGKITSETDNLSAEQVLYAYDSLNRLASAQTSGAGGWGLSYNYDGFGNLTDQNFIKGSVPTMHVAYNASNNLQTGDTADANGNLGVGYVYDLENRLVQPGSSATAHYAYDTGNKRVWRGDTSSGLDEIAFWAEMKLATYQVSTNGSVLSFALTSTRVYFAGKMISTGTYNSSGSGDKVNLAPVVADRQGSIKKFYPFGVERPSASANDTEKFTGYYRDATTGLDYADQRYEQPGSGRFMTPDPKSGSAQPNAPGSWNRYAYVKGDPINSTDPSGLDSDDLHWYSNPGFAPSVDEDQGVGYVLPSEVYQEAVYAYSAYGGCPSDPNVLLNTYLSSGNAYYQGAYDACTQPVADNTSQPTCSISLFERPVEIPDFGIAEHTYLYLQGPPAILPPFGNETVEGGPDFVDLPIGYLIGITSNPAGNGLDGTNPGAADNHQVGMSYSGPQACDDIRSIVNKVSQYNGGSNRSIYNPVPEIGPGHNSNSFTYTLLNDIGLSTFFGYFGIFAPGWGDLVPGLQ